jgi:hypothetical protein
MLPLKNRSHLFGFVFVPVIFVILGAFALSVASVIENVRFVGATAQVLGLVKAVRIYTVEQKTFSFVPGEDVWARMIQVGQMATSTDHINSWGGEVRLIAASATELRIENDLPSQDCRRMALYFLGLDPPGIGLLSIEAQSDLDETWSPIYPTPDSGQVAAAGVSCGATRQARLAFVFRLK